MHTILKHPLVDHRLSYMRDRETAPKLFRELVSEITAFLAFEALKDLNTVEVSFETPVAKTTGRKISDRIVLVPILRAGMGMLDAMLHVLPYAKVGVLGMQRNEETAEPIPYYSKVPPAKDDELAIVIDPMLATGGSAVDAVGQLKKLGYRRIKFLCLVSAPEGMDNFERNHPEVPVYAAAMDERLNSHFYIVPGLGDAGDRIFGTL
ncbi:MAG: uracil phosphoribosyltransferase [Verrucomicrobiota bacterium]|nr:uracil phosphoribosyltransferase [Verrucomicrobiota bacterium]MDY5597172.1 uracil phosphoribosyltransferase [Kiritimatiellia bacterium]